MVEFSKTKAVEFVERYKLITETSQSLKKNLEYYRERKTDEFIEVFNEFSEDLLDFWVHNISIRFCNWPDLDKTEIVVEMRIDYDESEIGRYRAFYSEEGNYIDDILDIY